jgi:hypothetical protein
LIGSGLARGESASLQTTELLNLLDLYGSAELRAAICEALERKTPRASSVEFILNQRRRFSHRRTPPPVDLSRHPELENLSVTPHDLETYDDLPKMIPTNNDLNSKLNKIGLRTISQNLDDFVAHATTGRWSPHMLLENCGYGTGRSFRRSLERREPFRNPEI